MTPEMDRAFDELLGRGDSKSIIYAAGWLRELVGEPHFGEFMSDVFSESPRILSEAHGLLA